MTNDQPTMTWKEQNKTYKILKDAEEGKYGVVAATAYNLEHIVAFVQAAEAKRSPFIIQFFPWAITATDGLLIQAAALAAKKATVPIALHLDHAQDDEVIRQAADGLPFDSIMIDMSHYDDYENAQRTKQLVAYCHARHITTEAESGHIEGGAEDTVADLDGIVTREEQVDQLLATGVDFLAPAFGNVHGDYEGPPSVALDYNCLRKVRTRIHHRVRLVLHGTNDFSEADLQTCIASGISKINANKLVLDDYLNFQRDKARKLPLPDQIDQGIKETRKLVEWQMDVCGSSGKA